MTAERDRLAALLTDINDERRAGAYPHLGREGDILALADRLIAAGVGFRSVGVEEAIAQAQANLAKSEAAADREITRLRALVEQPADLDVERLARALLKWEPMFSGNDAHREAAAIAAAYREDAR